MEAQVDKKQNKVDVSCISRIIEISRVKRWFKLIPLPEGIIYGDYLCSAPVHNTHQPLTHNTIVHYFFLSIK